GPATGTGRRVAQWTHQRPGCADTPGRRRHRAPPARASAPRERCAEVAVYSAYAAPGPTAEVLVATRASHAVDAVHSSAASVAGAGSASRPGAARNVSR